MKNHKTPKKINQNRLVKIFKDIKRLDSTESRFCFLIGAGASKSSGIKTGLELSVDWYKDLKEDLDPKELSSWEKEIGFNEDNLGEFYPYLYKKRYETSPQIGYDEFKKMMEFIEPDLGYVILSQILADGKHNFVITTNFDYLIEDAVRMYTATKPFSAGHEMLAEFISSQTERPTIIKVHRDLFLHPFNNDNETEKLKEEWERALTPILKNFSLLVIGYGGNDGSLMEYLKNINPQDRKPIYWCVRDNNNLNSKIEDLLTEKDFTVKISGFDELMYALNDALGYTIFENLDDATKHPFVLAAKERISSLNEKRKDLLDKLQKEKKQVSKETKELFKGSWKVLLEVLLEKDTDKKDAIYQKGLKLYPNDPAVIGSYALFLSSIGKEPDKAEDYYKKVIELDPKNADNIGNYALFLSDIRKDYDKAEDYYKKAIEIKPNYADLLGNYAHHLIISKQDFKKAEKYIDKSFYLSDDKNLGLLVELWFYRYAHYEKWRKIGEKELNKLITKGAVSKGWNLQAHIDIAKTNKTSDIEKLIKFAGLIK